MKKIPLFLLVIFASMVAFGQNNTTLGIGISAPVGTLHVHSSEGINPFIPPIIPTGTRDEMPFDYQTILHITNTATGSSAADGFAIDQYNGAVTIRQYEQASISLLGPTGVGFTLTPSGYFGLGTTSPTSRLHVNGNACIAGELTTTGLTRVGSGHQVLSIGKVHTSGLNHGTAYIGFNAKFSGSSWSTQNDGSKNGGAVIWATIDGDLLFANIASTGASNHAGMSDGDILDNVNLKLGADGLLQAKEIKVSISENDWPDFVFEEGYMVGTLEATEEYIKENGHLPGVPSASEVAEQGLNLGEMNKILVRKIEELTLQVIELQKQIDELKQN